VASSAGDGELILYEDWEERSFENWDDDFTQGDTVIGTSPAYKGKCAIIQKSSKPGNYVSYIGDHPQKALGFMDRAKRKLGMSYGKGEPITDITLEEYVHPSPDFRWPSHAMKLWVVNCFEGWGAGYKRSEGKGKPHSFAPYYMTIAVDRKGQPFGELVRADGLGGRGALWKGYNQNRGKKTALKPGVWNRLKIRLKLNTPRKRDGIFRLWVGDELLCDYRNMNYRGSYTKYGWNHLMMSIHAKPSHPKSQWVSRDEIRITSGGGERLPGPSVSRTKEGLPSSDLPGLILFEDWESNSVQNWDDDFSKGDTTIDRSPAFGGEYAIKQKSSSPGSYVHFFGDHPGVDAEPVYDVMLESYIHPSHGFEWPAHAMKLWIMNSFESWGAKYYMSEGRGKPHSWAPYYMTIAVNAKGELFAELVRADGLGGKGELWRGYPQNRGDRASLKPGVWNKLKITLKLNTPGKADGIFRLWLGDDLKCDYTDVNFRGTYTEYGWNHLMMSIHGKPSHPQAQWVSVDNIRLSRGNEEAGILQKLSAKDTAKVKAEPARKAEHRSPPKPVIKEPISKPNEPPKTPTGLRIARD